MRRFRRLFDAGFMSAVLFWGLGRLLRVQVHWILSAPLPLRVDDGTRAAPPISGFTLHALRDEGDLRELPPGVEGRLNEQSGAGCRKMIGCGDRVYAMTEGGRVACQLNLRSGTIRVDSPTILAFHCAPDDVFLNYLYTYDEYRGKGLARALIRFACDDATNSGKKRGLSHVRATNFASINAFRRVGWRVGAMILTTRSGRFLAAPGCDRIGMRVEALNHAGSNASTST